MFVRRSVFRPFTGWVLEVVQQSFRAQAVKKANLGGGDRGEQSIGHKRLVSIAQL